MSKKHEELEQKIGYTFQDETILKHALTHSSYTFESQMDPLSCNERLEFLGDAVLEVTSSEFLYKNYPSMSEGDMSRLRASIVCEESLAVVAKEFELGSYMLMGKGEEKCGGRIRPSVTSDALEALIGAIYLDGGFTNAKEFVNKFILNDIEKKSLFYDSKTILQEIVQSNFKCTPIYENIGESGPDHQKIFEAAVLINNEIYGRGQGSTKKSAQQHAAYNALTKIKEEKQV